MKIRNPFQLRWEEGRLGAIVMYLLCKIHVRKGGPAPHFYLGESVNNENMKSIPIALERGSSGGVSNVYTLINTCAQKGPRPPPFI